MTQATDAELWSNASSGEATAFGTIFERHANAVYNFCFRRTADWSLAEDLTSVVFLEAWRRRSGVVLAGDSARPWLLGVATNAIRHRRAQRRHRAALERLPRETEPDFVGDAEARLDDERRMRAALALPASSRGASKTSSRSAPGPI
jgi:RNA polymerase sigma-70 factor (ECF subfamily)